MSILGGVDGFVEKNHEYLLLAYTNTEIATNEQYQAWWSAFLDVAAVQGLSEGIKVVAERDQRPGQKPCWKYVVIFGFSGDAEKMREAVTNHQFKDDSALWFYNAIGTQREKQGLSDDKDEHIFMALTNVKPGRQADFDEWYNRHHVPDVVSVTPYRSGRRFKIVATGGAEAPWSYLSFYRFVGPAIQMHRILRIEMACHEYARTDSYQENDAAWIYGEKEQKADRTYRIGVIVGSLRKDSYCRRLAEYIGGFMPKDFEFVWVDLYGIDSFNEDHEKTPPASWTAFRDAISSVDAFLFITPEYNRSFSGVLKNAIDVGSRPWGCNKWGGKPGAAIGSSISALGAGPAVLQLKQVLSFLNVYLMNEPELYLTNVADVFDKNNSINDEDIAQYILTWADSFVAWVRVNAL